MADQNDLSANAAGGRRRCWAASRSRPPSSVAVNPGGNIAVLGALAIIAYLLCIAACIKVLLPHEIGM
jgi:hypothetical protein